MIKFLVLTSWLLLFIGVQTHAAPMVIQLDQKQGATPLTVHQGVNMNLDNQINVMNAEEPLFGFVLSPLIHEEFERLQLYSSDFGGESNVLDTARIRMHHSVVVGLHSIMATIVEGMELAREIIHVASTKASSLWRTSPSLPPIVSSAPELYYEGDVEQAFQNDANYFARDLSENQFGNTGNLEPFERFRVRLMRSRVDHSPLEPAEDTAESDWENRWGTTEHS